MAVKRKESRVFDDRKFRILIEKSSDVIVLIDAKANVLYASPSIVRLYGRKYKEFLGISSIKYVHPTDIPPLLKHLTEIVFSPKKTIEMELRIKHKNGEWKWVLASARNLLHDKDIRAIVVNFHDITERKEMEARKDEFISIASHELKTPFSALKIYIQLLWKMYKDDKSELSSYLEKINSQMDKLSHLLNELLDVSRIQQGKIILNKEKFEISLLIKEVINEMQQITDKHKLRRRISTKKIIYADKERITQVLRNLITNAVKYSPEPADIIISCCEKRKMLHISVKDYGVGISSRNAARIFERFFQEERTTRPLPGLGLGLYISSIFIKEHGGEITVKSEKGKGSTFTFSLPL